MSRAADFFQDSANKYSNVHGTSEQAEKYNFYFGLIELCAQIDKIENKIVNLEHAVGGIERRIK